MAHLVLCIPFNCRSGGQRYPSRDARVASGAKKSERGRIQFFSRKCFENLITFSLGSPSHTVALPALDYIINEQKVGLWRCKQPPQSSRANKKKTIPNVLISSCRRKLLHFHDKFQRISSDSVLVFIFSLA